MERVIMVPFRSSELSSAPTFLSGWVLLFGTLDTKARSGLRNLLHFYSHTLIRDILSLEYCLSCLSLDLAPRLSLGFFCP